MRIRPRVALATILAALLGVQSDASFRAVLQAAAGPLDSGVLVGAGGGTGLVRILSRVDGTELASGIPFDPAFTGGVRVAAGDVTGDGISDAIVAMGPGGGLVKALDGANLSIGIAGYPFGPAFAGGVFVAVGDVNGDGRGDLIASQGAGGGLVHVLNGADASLIAAVEPFGPDFTGGVRVASGDVNGDGRDDLIAAQASGGLVSVTSGADGTVLAQGFVYAPNLQGGVYVAAGDVNGDGRDDVITAPGSGSGPVYALDAASGTVLTAIVPFSSAFNGGVRVAAADLTGEGRAEILTAAGPGGRPEIRVFAGDGALLAVAPAFAPDFARGVFIATPARIRTRFTSADRATFTAGSAGSFEVRTVASPQVTSITLSGALPAGVTFTDRGNGTATLDGTPEIGSAGSYPLTLTASNGIAAPAAQTFTLEVIDTAPRVTATIPASGATGVPWDTPIVVTFSEPVNVTPGAFTLECPAGTPVPVTVLTSSPATQFTLAPATDLPPTTACTLRVAADQVTDADGNDPPDALTADVTVAFDTSACPALHITPTTLAAGNVSVVYGPITFVQTGMVGLTTWSVTSGSLPPGILLNPATGTITGTPTSSGTFNFTMTATVAGCSAGVPLTLTIGAGPNQAPTFTIGANQSVLEDAGSQTVPNWATGISPGPPDESGQSLSFSVVGNTNPALFSSGPAVAPDGTLTYTPAANAAGTATITLELKDNGGTALGGTDTSAPQSFTITVAEVNDAPSFVAGPNVVSPEDGGPQAITNWATSISPGPAAETGQNVTFVVTGNTNPALFSAGPAVSPTGTLTYTTAPDAFGTADITVVLQDDGGTANGGVNSSAPQTFIITVTPVNDRPTLTASTISYTTAGNTQLHVAGETLPGLAAATDSSGVLGKSGPTDSDGPSTPAAVPLTNEVTPHGTITLNADGSFSYLPDAGFTGVDSFTVQVTDSVTPVDVTVNITVGDRVWYVNNETGPNNAAGGDGRSTDAFETLSAAASAAGEDDIIFVFNGASGTTPLTGGIALANGQKLYGEGVGLTVGSLSLVAAGTQPRIASAGDAVTVLASTSNGNRTGVEIRGLNLASSAGNAIDVTATDAASVGVRISENTISSAGSEGIDVTHASTGTAVLDVHGNVITSAGTGIDITRTGGAVIITAFADNIVSGNSGGGISVSGPATFDAVPGGALDPVSGGATRIGQSGNGVSGAGLVMSSVTGALDFTALDVFADTNAALSVAGTGAFTGAAGTRVTAPPGLATLVASAGTALALSNLTADLQLGGLTSANSGGDGVSLVNVGGTIAAPSASTITNAANVAFAISGGDATVTYNGTISDDLGYLVTISGATGGIKRFTGAITDGNDGDGAGIALSGNAGATIAFSGGLTLSTGSNPAFSATGGGTVTVTDPAGPDANTIVTTTGTALNVANTTIGSDGLVFQSVSADGAANGIVLNATGALGGLTVSGTGANDSGGVIQNTSGDAVLLVSTRNVSLSQMRLVNAGESHIDATNVTGLALSGVDTDLSADHGLLGNGITNLTIAGGTFNRGGVGSEPVCNVNGVNITNLLGTSSVTGATFTRSNTIQFRVNNTTTSGSVDTLTVSGTNWNTHIGPCAGDHLSVNADTNANFKLVTTSASGENVFQGAGIGVQATASGTGTMQASITGVETSGNTAGVVLAATGASNIGFNVFDNNSVNGTGFSGTGSVALALTCTTSATCQGAFTNNSIQHTAGTSTNAMQVVVEGNGTGIVTVANNTINGNFQRGFHGRVGAGTGAGNLSLNVTGNTVTATDAGVLQGIDLSTSLSGDTTIVNTMCLNLANNTTSVPAGSAYRLLSRASDVFRLQNFTGNGSVAADVQAWITTTKSNTGTPVSVTMTDPFTSTASCPVPTLPAP